MPDKTTPVAFRLGTPDYKRIKRKIRLSGKDISVNDYCKRMALNSLRSTWEGYHIAEYLKMLRGSLLKVLHC
jgi:hypothetical protein